MQAIKRKLHSGHFAFMRAVVQGQDLQSNWDRHLRIEAPHIDGPRMRSAITWMSTELFAAAQRLGMSETSALVFLVDAEQLDSVKSSPIVQGHVQSERLDRQGTPIEDSGANRARLIERQLEALRWLESVAAETPKAGDSVYAWLRPSLARHVEKAGMPTIAALIERINALGNEDWWTELKGVGKGKAGRIVEWLKLNQTSIDMCIGGHHLGGAQADSQSRHASTPPILTAVQPHPVRP